MANPKADYTNDTVTVSNNAPAAGVGNPDAAIPQNVSLKTATLDSVSLRFDDSGSEEEVQLFAKRDADGNSALWIRRASGVEEPFQSRFRFTTGHGAPPPDTMGRTNDVFFDQDTGDWWQRRNGEWVGVGNGWPAMVVRSATTSGNTGSFAVVIEEGALKFDVNFPAPGSGIKGEDGSTPPNPAFTVTVTMLASGATPTASVTGTYPNLSIALGIPAPLHGSNGASPTVSMGTVSTLAAGANATATLTGTYPNYNLNLGLPQGTKGNDGVSPSPATLSIGTVTTLAPGAQATASIGGNYPNYTVNLGLPKGTTGDPGTPGAAANITVGTVTALAAGSTPTVTISGAAPNYTLSFGIPRGTDGATPALSIGTVTTGAAGSSASATLGGTAAAPVLNLTIPRGNTGAAGVVGYGAFASQSLKIWSGTVTTDSSGNFTANYSAAGFTVAPYVNATALTTGNAASGAALANINAPGTTSVSGFVTIPASTTVSILGAIVNPLIKAPANTSIQILAIGY